MTDSFLKSEYEQEMQQSQTADQPMAPRASEATDRHQEDN